MQRRLRQPRAAAGEPDRKLAPLTLPHSLQVRDLISDFYNSRYASCLAHLAALRPALALDIHLHDHAQVCTITAGSCVLLLAALLPCTFT